MFTIRPSLGADVVPSCMADTLIIGSGQRHDIAEWLPGLDLPVLPSVLGEANTIGEVMASGAACVATDIGDSRTIVGEDGLAVPPGKPEAMQAAIAQFLWLSPDARCALGLAAHARPMQLFSLPTIAQHSAALYGSVIGSWQSWFNVHVTLGAAGVA